MESKNTLAIPAPPPQKAGQGPKTLLKSRVFQLGPGGISIKSRRAGSPQGALRGHTSVFIGIICIPTKAQVHDGNHAPTRALRFCVDAL